MSSVYIPKPVGQILEYYGPLLYHYEKGMTIRNRLEALAKHLWAGVVNDHDAICMQINNYHPGFIGQQWIEIKNNGFSKEDAYLTIAREYGFKDFESVPDKQLNIAFERAVDILLEAREDPLEVALTANPGIIHLKSGYGHKATLLHYASNNGVELYRQVVPLNLPSLIRLLVSHGADLQATMDVYNGQYTLKELVATSAHPHDAGLHDAILSAIADLSQ